MKEFIDEFTTFRRAMKADNKRLSYSDVVSLYAIYRKDVCRAKMQSAKNGAKAPASATNGNPYVATERQIAKLAELEAEGKLEGLTFEQIQNLTKEEASRLISEALGGE